MIADRAGLTVSTRARNWKNGTLSSKCTSVRVAVMSAVPVAIPSDSLLPTHEKLPLVRTPDELTVALM